MDNTRLKDRILPLTSTANHQGRCVLYIMSRDQRVQDNHALLAAQKHALARRLPLAVVFCVYPKSGHRAREHYDFMLQGLKHVEKSLEAYCIPFIMLIGEPLQKLSSAFHHYAPEAVYFDMNPLRGSRRLQAFLASSFRIPMYVVDTHNCVPLWVASQKQEVAAYTMRPKLHKLLDSYLVEPEKIQKHPHVWPGSIQKMTELDELIKASLSHLPNNNLRYAYASGEEAAHNQFENWLTSSLETYGIARNNPADDAQSGMSPYLHFGQISSLRIALRLREIAFQHTWSLHLLESSKMPQPSSQALRYSIDAYIEELIVRKELADNFCWHQPHYDSIDAAVDWSKRSLDAHRSDRREYVYTYDELATARTHDSLWNASQCQLIHEGKIHGYMRTYWAKKVLEWTDSPEQAIECLIRLNDFYSIDGGDPNGYVGILWSIAGVHDRPWFDRPIIGLVRAMTRSGIERKFNAEVYIDKYVNK